MKKKSEKQKEIESLRQELGETQNIFVAGFEKLTVQQDFQLRKTVRAVGGQYRVVKNNLAAKAVEGTAAASILSDLVGMTSLAYTRTDPVALAKALTTYAKENPTFTFKAGLVEGRAVDVKGIESLATMPAREQILAKLLYLINAPAQRLATVINAAGRNLAVVIDQGCKEGKFQS